MTHGGFSRLDGGFSLKFSFFSIYLFIEEKLKRTLNPPYPQSLSLFVKKIWRDKCWQIFIATEHWVWCRMPLAMMAN